jgi:hypothetical protein
LVTRVRRRAIEHLYNIRKKFRITNEQYLILYKDATCWVCGATESIVAGQVGRLVVDHDHSQDDEKGLSTPQAIRGILCHACNMAIGLAEDNPQMLRRMAEYLENYQVNGGPFK